MELSDITVDLKKNEFSNKRVLIVGKWNSGVDIACEAATYANEAYWSMRRGYHFLPKHIMGMPSDVFTHDGSKIPMWIQQKLFGFLLKIVVGDQIKFGLTKPDHKLFESL
jgi:cation diffusion facilitator CzcD-associated flavoprotein CzcO